MAASKYPTANKQTAVVVVNGATLTWNHERTGPMSVREASRFYVDAAKASKRFEAKDPRNQAVLAPLLALACGFALLLSWARGDASPDAGALPAQGTLPALDAYDRELEHAEQRLYTRVVNYLEDHTQVTLGNPEVRNNADGTHDVLVPVAWYADPKPVADVLADYFFVHEADVAPKPAPAPLAPKLTSSVIGVVASERAKTKSVHSDALFGWLAKRRLHIVVSLEDHAGQLTIAAPRDCGRACREPERAQYQMQLSRDFDAPQLTFAANRSADNPVVLRHVPTELLDKLGRVHASVEWMDME